MKKIGLTAAFLSVLALSPALSVGGHPPAQSAQAACAKAPAWTTSPTKFGVSLSVSGSGSLLDDLNTEEARFGKRIPVVRTWDNGVPPDNAWTKRASWYGTRWVVTSIKIAPQDVLAGKYDAQLKNYFSTAPTNTPIFWSYFHEPEDEIKAGKFTAAQYRSAWQHIGDIAASYCKSNLYPTLILMGWTAQSASKLNWQDYYPGSSYISVLGWDPYNGANGDATSYQDPAAIFDSVVAASKAAGSW